MTENEAISHQTFQNWKSSECTKTIKAILEEALELARNEIRKGTESLAKIDIDKLNMKRGALVEIKRLLPVFDDRKSLNDFINKQEEENE
jgi:hypothetical protein